MTEQNNKDLEITLNMVRCGYLTLFNAKVPDYGGEAKFSAEVLVSKQDKEGKAKLNKAINAAVASKWGTNIPKHLKLPLRDGDIPGENGMGKKSAEPGSEPYGGHFFMSASNTRKPGLVDHNLDDIIREEQIKSGDYFNVSLRFYPFDTSGNRGVGVSLQGLQFVKEGEPLVATFNAKDTFEPIAPSEAGDEDVDFLGALGND